jgi:hypothetical protein
MDNCSLVVKINGGQATHFFKSLNSLVFFILGANDCNSFIHQPYLSRYSLHLENEISCMGHMYLLPNFIDRNDDIIPSVIPKTRWIIAEPTRIFRKLLEI